MWGDVFQVTHKGDRHLELEFAVIGDIGDEIHRLFASDSSRDSDF
jgi:hypothetical protein